MTDLQQAQEKRDLFKLLLKKAQRRHEKSHHLLALYNSACDEYHAAEKAASKGAKPTKEAAK